MNGALMKKTYLKFAIILLLTPFILGLVVLLSKTVILGYDMPLNASVGLRYGNTAVNVAQLESENGLTIGSVANESFEPSLVLDSAIVVLASVENGVIVLKDSNGQLIETSQIEQPYCIMPSNADTDSIIRFNNAPYRGGIILKLDVNNKITVINWLDTEAYLYGVIHQEMSQSNPIEALKAQAIAARTYFAVRRFAHQIDGFDVCTTTHCQVYKGFGGEYATTNQAVDETRGLMMYANALPVQAYYHKNSGGQTENSENVWSSEIPYLRGIPDPYSPEYTWTYELFLEDMQAKLEENGYDPGTIETVNIINNLDSGSAAALEIGGSKNDLILQKEKIRAVFGYTVIKSLYFNIGQGTSQINIYSANGKGTSSGDLYVISSNGKSTKTMTSDLYMFNGITKIKAAQSEVASGSILFSGKGYGHRVGMSQDGAIEMAKQGLTYEDILNYYYTAIEIR
jgi:stage II sporulation protein D